MTGELHRFIVTISPSGDTTNDITAEEEVQAMRDALWSVLFDGGYEPKDCLVHERLVQKWEVQA